MLKRIILTLVLLWNEIILLGRYLVVLYYQPAKFQRRAEAEEKQKELEELRRRVQKKKAQMARTAEN